MHAASDIKRPRRARGARPNGMNAEWQGRSRERSQGTRLPEGGRNGRSRKKLRDSGRSIAFPSSRSSCSRSCLAISFVVISVNERMHERNEVGTSVDREDPTRRQWICIKVGAHGFLALCDAFPRCPRFPRGRSRPRGVRLPRDHFLRIVVCSPIARQPGETGSKLSSVPLCPSIVRLPHTGIPIMSTFARQKLVQLTGNSWRQSLTAGIFHHRSNVPRVWRRIRLSLFGRGACTPLLLLCVIGMSTMIFSSARSNWTVRWWPVSGFAVDALYVQCTRQTGTGL